MKLTAWDGRGIDLLKCPNIGFTSVSKYILVNSTAVPSSVKIFPQYQQLFLQDVLVLWASFFCLQIYLGFFFIRFGFHKYFMRWKYLWKPNLMEKSPNIFVNKKSRLTVPMHPAKITADIGEMFWRLVVPYHHCAANAKAEDQEGIAFICFFLCKQCNLKGRYMAANDDSTC